MTITHRMSHKHPLYSRWQGMRARCNYPEHVAYTNYGGRGIKVCERWNDFVVFVEDMGSSWPGPGYELHRVDNDGDYEPANCAWVQTNAHRAMPKTADHRAKIGAAHRGRRKSAEHVAKVADAQRAQLDPEWLRQAYVDRGMSVYAIAAEAGCGKSSVHRAIKRLGIERIK